MLRRILTAVKTAALVLLCCGRAWCGVPESTVHIAGFNYKVVMKGTGSGFCYAKGYVLTAAHVADMGSEVRVRDHNGTWHNATVVKKGKPDWAVLSVPTLKVDALPLDADGVRQNETVTAYGRFGEGIRLNAGVVQDWRPFQGKYQHATTQVYPGFSGGPVVGRDGRVVGIVSMQTPSGSCLYVPVGCVK